MERLVRATGHVLAACPADTAPTPLAHPAEELVDEAGRHYPAHLDIRRVTAAKDWWGAWWAHFYDLPRNRWPRQAPDHTFDLDRARRDRRRRIQLGRAQVARLRIERRVGDNAPPQVWRWTAVDPHTDRVVGWLGGFVRRRVDGQPEFLVCDIEVAEAWQRLGVGRRLMQALREAMAAGGVPSAHVLIDEIGLPVGFFFACGFYPTAPQPTGLTLLLPASRSGPRSCGGQQPC